MAPGKRVAPAKEWTEGEDEKREKLLVAQDDSQDDDGDKPLNHVRSKQSKK